MKLPIFAFTVALGALCACSQKAPFHTTAQSQKSNQTGDLNHVDKPNDPGTTTPTDHQANSDGSTNISILTEGQKITLSHDKLTIFGADAKTIADKLIMTNAKGAKVSRFISCESTSEKSECFLELKDIGKGEFKEISPPSDSAKKTTTSYQLKNSLHIWFQTEVAKSFFEDLHSSADVEQETIDPMPGWAAGTKRTGRHIQCAQSTPLKTGIVQYDCNVFIDLPSGDILAPKEGWALK